MASAIRHRGPDGMGFLVDREIGLAHARLSIIDIAGGAQPIHNEDCTVHVVFNGEVFNYVELRRDLQQLGHRFYTQSDTEVLVHLYEEYGEEFVVHLNGQFAIALWDSTKRQLLLARDRTGIRPLFYTTTADRLVFGSEVKAIFAQSSVPRCLDTSALAEVFTYWAPLETRTVFEGVRELAPGHLMVVRDARMRTTRYWDWTFPDSFQSTRSIDDCAAELHEILLDAVRLQLRADVPVGAYLSGGLDSSILTTIIRNHTDTPLRTFSLTFAEEEFDERAHQRTLVDHLGTDHSSIQVDASDIGSAFPRTIWHTEVPIVRTAPTPLMLLSGHVRTAGYKVVLTGEGADEVFAGYDLFREAKIRRFLAREPNSRWRGRILERLYPYLKHSPSAKTAFAERFFNEGVEHLEQPWFAHVPRMTTTRRALQFLRPEIRQRVLARDPYAALGDTLPAQIRGWPPLCRDQYVEAHTLMSGYLLSSQGDRVAMANSIEGRVPYLDHRLIEFANGLPPNYKLRGLAEKFILKQSMRREIPPSITQRAKQPYRAPDSASFFPQGKALDYVAELLNARRVEEAGVFDPTAVGKLYAKCQAGRAIGFGDNMAFVGVLSTMLVHAQFVAPAGGPRPLEGG